jgi:protein-S-isoprenylcysteine O-methyltransferase Ste14
MATVLRILVFLAFACLAFQMLLFGSRIKGNALGKPPIAWPALALAKLSLAVSLVLMFYEAVRGKRDPSPLAAAAILCLLAGGGIIGTLAFRGLGANLRVGLPGEETTFVNSGIYGRSRNPIYLALFCLLGSSLLYAFSWINLACVLIAVALHHRIVLSEERFLEGRFANYAAYRNNVRRYL